MALPIACCKKACEATCIDVGHGQLHYKLRIDPRVTNIEKINIRNLKQDELNGSPYPLVVMDLSFISLKSFMSDLELRRVLG